jgi:hypothetical protein
MTMKTAFFLSETGDLIHVPQNHISTIIAEPERFGLSREEVQAVYDNYGERLGLEGQAREEILLKIIADGWIRLRRYPNRYWSISAQSLTPAVKERLRQRAEWMLSGTKNFKESDKYMPVRISTSEGEIIYTIGDLAADFCSCSAAAFCLHFKITRRGNWMPLREIELFLKKRFAVLRRFRPDQKPDPNRSSANHNDPITTDSQAILTDFRMTRGSAPIPPPALPARKSPG